MRTFSTASKKRMSLPASTPIRSVCVHGDSAHAVATARAVRARLEGAGVRLAPFRA